MTPTCSSCGAELTAQPECPSCGERARGRMAVPMTMADLRMPAWWKVLTLAVLAIAAFMAVVNVLALILTITGKEKFAAYVADFYPLTASESDDMGIPDTSFAIPVAIGFLVALLVWEIATRRHVRSQLGEFEGRQATRHWTTRLAIGFFFASFLIRMVLTPRLPSGVTVEQARAALWKIYDMAVLTGITASLFTVTVGVSIWIMASRLGWPIRRESAVTPSA